MSNDNTLPEELQEQIGREAKAKAEKLKGERSPGYCFGYENGFYDGATEYAPYKQKYHRAKTLLETLVMDLELGSEMSRPLYIQIKSFLDGSK